MRAPKQSHFIQRFKFDFEIEQKEDAHKLHTDLSRIFNQRIKAMLDEIMSELDDPLHVVRIPQLVIDLGEIYEGSLEREVMIRFEHAFRKELQLRLGELRHTRVAKSAEKGEVIALMPARIEIVTFFLMNGRLPTGAEQMAGKVEQLFMELVESEPQGILRMLKAIAPYPAAMQRLATAFSEKLIARVYGVILSDNAISIASIEKKLVEEAAKKVNKPRAVITMEVRRAIFKYLLVDAPTIFDRRKFQAAVTQEMVKGLGEEAVEGLAELQEKQEEFENQNEKRAKRQAALEVLQRYLKRSVPAESPMSVVEAWEYLVTQDAPSIRKLLGNRSIAMASIVELVKLLTPSAMRDFVQKVVPTSPVQLIHVAASVVSAFSIYRKGTTAEKNFAAEVYAVLVQQLAVNPSTTPTATKVAEAIKAHLAKVPDVPREMLKQWEELDLPGVSSADKQRKQKAEKEAADAQAQKEFEDQVAELKARKKSTLEETEEAEKEVEEAAEEAEKAKESKPKGKKGKDKAQAAKEKLEGEEGEEKEEEVDDASFFKRSREQLTKRGIEIEALGETEEDLVSRIDTPEGRMELVLQMMVSGTRPWWSESINAVQMEIYLKALISKHPEVVKEAFQRLLRTTPASRIEEIASKIIGTVNEATLTNLMAALAPDIAGFAVTVSLALAAMFDAPQTASLTIPSQLAQKWQFIWQPQLRYIMEYISSGYSVNQLVRYVLKQHAAALGIGARDMIERMAAIAEEAIVKGEKRFNAFKTILPKVFEGLQVTPPQPQEPEKEIWERLQALEAAAERTAKPVEGEERELPKIDFEEAMPPTASEQFLLDRLKKARQKAEEQKRLEEEAAKVQAAEKERLEAAPITQEGVDSPAVEEGKEIRPQPEKKEQVGGETATPLDKSAEVPKEMEAEETPAEKEKEPKRPRSETPSEAEEEAEAEMVLEVIRQFLEHGTLSPAATEYFTPQTFKALLQGTFALPSRPLITMLRSSMTKKSARLRVISQGDDLALQVTNLLQTLIADKMRPFLQDLLRVFEGSSSPVSKVHVWDHAMIFALQAGGTGFVPLQYVRSFVEYVAALPGKDVKQVLLWANKRLETSASPLKEALLEVLDVVERIADTQSQQKQRKPQSQTPSRPIAIKTPDGDIYITNAGAGLIHIIFKQLFKAFDLLTDDGLAFRSKEGATRAAHYIQYLTDKELDPPEEKMVFNKLLVGLSIDQPLEPLGEPMNQDEIDTCEYVLQTLCDKWTAMKNAGPDYVRKTFLMREGRLRNNGDNWIVRVEQTGLDILKNKIPWATNPIRLPWLTYLIDVDWP